MDKVERAFLRSLLLAYFTPSRLSITTYLALIEYYPMYIASFYTKLKTFLQFFLYSIMRE